jgi:hypothetical protein
LYKKDYTKTYLKKLLDEVSEQDKHMEEILKDELNNLLQQAIEKTTTYHETGFSEEKLIIDHERLKELLYKLINESQGDKPMPVKVKKVDGYRVSTPHGVKAKNTTKKKAEAQKRLLNAVEHGFVPTGKPAQEKHIEKRRERQKRTKK